LTDERRGFAAASLLLPTEVAVASQRDPQRSTELRQLYLRQGTEHELAGQRSGAAHSYRGAYRLLDESASLGMRHKVTQRLAAALLAAGETEEALTVLASLTPEIGAAAAEVRFFHLALLARTLDAAGRDVEARARYAHMLSVAERIGARERFNELALCAAFLSARGEREATRAVLALLDASAATEVA
jgi:hypothetical protein